MLWLCAVFFLFSCKAWQKTTPLDDQMVETPAASYAIDQLPEGILPVAEEDVARIELRLLLRQYGLVDSFIVIYRDQLCCEKYFNGYNRHIRHKVCSVGKSAISLLTGAMINQGKITLEEKLLDVLAGDYPSEEIENNGLLKEMITLETLLKMSAGFAWEELKISFFLPNGQPNPQNSLVKMLSDNDPIKYLLDLPIITPPGLFFNYNSGEPILAETMLEKKTGEKINSLMQEYLFTPSGITSFSWEKVSDNETKKEGGLQMHPVDMAQLGRLVLKRGRLNNQQIVSEEWISKSTSRQIAVSVPFLDKDVDGYGFYWWKLNDEEVGKYLRINDITFAWGFGGQIVVICPHLDTVIISTGRNYQGFQETIQLFKEVIVPLLTAIEKSQN